MVIAYDQEVRSRQIFIDEAKQREEAEKKQVAENMALLSAELESAKKSSLDTFKHLQAVTVEKKKNDERLAVLEAELLTLRSSRERDIEDAVAIARRTAAGEAQAQLARAYELFREMMGRPMTSLIHYSQAVANLELLDLVEDPEEPFDPATERVFVEEQKAKLGRADDAYDKLADELKKVLGKNYELSIYSADIVFSPRLETVAKSVGITTASGSNDGSFGLRLRDASEELNRSGGSGDEAAKDDEVAATEKEVATVAPQNELAPTDPVAEDPLNEAASSAAPGNQTEEKEKEDGEL